jgi:peptidyl-prolyl cis-trans isomerase C
MRIFPYKRNGLFAPTQRPRLRTRRSRWFGAGLFVGFLCLGAHALADAADMVVATFTAGAITKADLEKVLTQRLPVQKDLATRPGAVKEILESMLRYDLLAQEAEGRGYRNNLRVRAAAQAKANDLLMIEQATTDPSKISKAEIERMFAEHKRDFVRPALRRASHVLLSTKAEAEALIAELKGATRERFARAATANSQDPNSKNQGGELGYFDREGLTERGVAGLATPPLAAAAFKLAAVGDITAQPVAVANGFSVLMLTGEMKAYSAPRNEVEERIREQLAKEQGTAKLDALYAQLRTKYAVQAHEQLVDLVVLPPAEPSQIPSGFPAAPPDPREPPKFIEPDGI